MALLGGLFDILRIVIAAINDDHVLDTPRHKQDVTAQKAQISRTKKRAIIRISQSRFEYRLGLIGPLPISRSHARTGHPYFAYGARRATGKSRGVNDRHVDARRLASASDRGPDAAPIFIGLDRAAALKLNRRERI